MITDASLALASWLLCILVLVLSLLALAHWNARPVTLVDDPTPFEDVPLWHDGSGGGHDWDGVEILAVDPPVVPAYAAKVTELDDMLRHATDPKVRDLLLDRRLKATKETVT